MSFVINMPGVKTLLNEEFAKIPGDAHEAYKQLVMKGVVHEVIEMFNRASIAFSSEQEAELHMYVTELITNEEKIRLYRSILCGMYPCHLAPRAVSRRMADAYQLGCQDEFKEWMLSFPDLRTGTREVLVTGMYNNQPAF